MEEESRKEKSAQEKPSTGVVLKSGFWYTFSSVCLRAIGIISAPIYTHMLTTADYGIANTYNSWISIINIFTCLCLISSVGRAKLDFYDDYDAYLSSVQALSSSVAFVILLGVCVFIKPLSAWMGYSQGLVVVMFVYLIFSPSVDYIMNKYRFQYRYKENILISMASTVGTVALSVILMLVFSGQRYVGKILGTLLPTFLMGVFFYVKIWKKGRTFFNKVYWTYALKLSLPLIPHNLALNILVQIDRIMIKDICGEAQAGVYTFGYVYATLLAIFTNAIGQAWQPWFNEQMAEENRGGIRRVNKLIMQLGCFLSIGFIIVGPEALKILGTPDYYEARWVIAPIVLGTLCQYFYTNYVDIELFHRRTTIIALSSVLAAAVNYLLNYICIPRFGYRIAAYTTLVGYLFLLLFHFLATRLILRERVFDTPFRLLLLAGTGVLGFGFMALYDNWLLRYGAAVLFTVVLAFWKKNDIMLLIRFIQEKYLGNTRWGVKKNR